jgi:hypothetical protein
MEDYQIIIFIGNTGIQILLYSDGLFLFKSLELIKRGALGNSHNTVICDFKTDNGGRTV